MSAETIVSIVFGVIMFLLASLALVQGYKYRFRTPVTPVSSIETPMSPPLPPMSGLINVCDNNAALQNFIEGKEI